MTNSKTRINEPHYCCAHVSLMLDVANKYETKAEYLLTGSERQKALAAEFMRVVRELRAAVGVEV